MRNKKIIALLTLIVIATSGCGKKSTDIKAVGVESDKTTTATTTTIKEDEKIEVLVSEVKKIEPEVKSTEAPVATKPKVKVEERAVVVEQKKTESVPVVTTPKTETAKVVAPKPVVTTTKPVTSTPTTKLTAISKPGIYCFESISIKGVVLGTAKITEASGFKKEEMDVLNKALKLNKAAYDDFQKNKTFVGMTNVDRDEAGNEVYTPIIIASKALIDAKIILRDTNIRNAEVTAMCNEVIYVHTEICNYVWTWAAKLGYKNYATFHASNSVESIAFLTSVFGLETPIVEYTAIKNGEKVY